MGTNKLNIDSILRRVDGVPPLPAAVTQLRSLAEDMDADIGEMARVISMDQALTGRILRVANSAFYGLSRRIVTVSHAIVILGFREVRNLAIGLSLVAFKLGKKDNLPLEPEDFWRHSLAVGSAARLLGKYFHLGEPEEAFVAGLIHDIGKLIFMEYFPEQYADVLQAASTGGKPLYLVEREQLGITHAEVGRKLCEHWNIPPALARVAASHHAAEFSSKDDIAGAIRIANSLAKLADIGSSGDEHVERDVFKRIDEKKVAGGLHKILLELPEEVRKAEVLLDLTPCADEAQHEEGSKSPALIVSVQDPEESDIVVMTLLAMGYAAGSPEQVLQDKGAEPVGVIGDDSLAPDLVDYCCDRDIPVISFARWRRESDPSNAASVDVEQLRAWLRENLETALSEVSP